MKTFEWFCFSLKYKGFVKFSKKNLYCLVVFLIYKRFFLSLRSSFFNLGKNFAPPQRIGPSFLAPGQGKLIKNCPGGQAEKISRCCPWGRCTHFELTQTLRTSSEQFENGLCQEHLTEFSKKLRMCMWHD